MKQFCLPCEPDSQGRIDLTGRDYHYLAKVLRMRPGEKLEALSPAGSRGSLTILSLEEKSLRATFAPHPDAASPSDTTLPLHLTLLQALPKESKMDLIVRQAVEAGVAEIRPFISAASPQGKNFRYERWERIMREARQQSGSAVATVLHQPLSLREVVAGFSGRGILFSPEYGLSLEKGLEKLSKEEYNRGLGLAIGAEGGFSASEKEAFEGAGFMQVRLACLNVLRCETAALYAIAAVQSSYASREQRFGEMKGNEP